MGGHERQSRPQGVATVRALVLSGGGALGAYEAGAIARLHADGNAFDLFCGTSIGALNASFVAQGRFDDLARVWKTIAQAGVINLEPEAAKLLSIAEELKQIAGDKPLEKVGDVLRLGHELFGLGPVSRIFTTLGGVSPTAIEAVLAANLDFDCLTRDIIISTTNLTSGASDAFYWFRDARRGAAFAANHDKGTAHPLASTNFRDAVRASAAIPFAFAPVPITRPDSTGIADYVDGGVANNTPIGVAIDAGADDVTTILLNPKDDHSPQAIDNLINVGLSCFGIMQQRILELDLKSADRVNAAVGAGAGGSGSRSDMPRFSVTLREVRPSTPLPLSVLQFDRQDLISEAYERGYADAAPVSQALQQTLTSAN
jgi:predicted acylesterase/phospholipase RssA